MVGTKHADAGSKLGASEGHHVLPNVCGHSLSVLWIGVVEYPLDQIIAILIAGNINERDTGTVSSTLADTVQIPAKELIASYL